MVECDFDVCDCDDAEEEGVAFGDDDDDDDSGGTVVVVFFRSGFCLFVDVVKHRRHIGRRYRDCRACLMGQSILIVLYVMSK